MKVGVRPGGTADFRDQFAPTAKFEGVISTNAWCPLQAKISEMVAAAKDGDVCVLHFSGHGTQIPSQDGEEKGKRLLSETFWRAKAVRFFHRESVPGFGDPRYSAVVRSMFSTTRT